MGRRMGPAISRGVRPLGGLVKELLAKGRLRD
jgi:hypothetical protein